MKPKLVFASIIAFAALAPNAGFADSMTPDTPAATTPCCPAPGDINGDGTVRRAVVIPTDARDVVKKCTAAGGKVIRQSTLTICGGLDIGVEIRW